MKSEIIKKGFFVILRLILGGIMVYGGYQKFAKPLPAPTDIITEIQSQDAEKTQKLLNNPNKLIIKNYIFGMKQTGYLWQVLGVCELVFGLMILSQYLSFVGALMLFPITLNIFFFHTFLTPDNTMGVIEGITFLCINILLITKEYDKFRPLLWIKL